MNKKIFQLSFILLLIFLNSCLYSQFRKENPFIIEPGIYTEYHILPDSSGYLFYFSYRVEYNHLIFEKKDDNIYESSFYFLIEIYDSLKKDIIRLNSSKTVQTSFFENTKSKTEYSQGLVKTHLPAGYYKLITTFYDLNNSKEYNLIPVNFNTYSDSNTILLPMVVRLHNDNMQLANFSNAIPFSNDNYSLLISVLDTNIKKLKIIIKTNNEESVHIANESFVSSLNFYESNDQIYMNKNGKRETKNFLVKDFSTKYNEGIIILSIIDGDSVYKQLNCSIPVRWFDKPAILRNLDYSIKVLSNIEEPSVIEQLNKIQKDSIQFGFNEYWNRLDPSPGTKYNELMVEFYNRVEYAIKNFSTLAKYDGAETDRGKIYIKFGVPDEIKRSKNSENKILEIWEYKSIDKVFTFVDNNGTGNFKIISK